MPDYGRPLEFGASIVPAASAIAEAREIMRGAEDAGIDLIGIQDHPYQWRFLDTWTLMAWLLAQSSRVRIFPNVANLPLRGPAMIAKQAASLDVLSGGRFELGLGAGAFWEAIGAMGGPLRTPGESLQALEEAIGIILRFWSAERTIAFPGRLYSVKGVHPGPQPVHPVGIWVGAYKPRALRLIGRVADGWIPSIGYLPPEQVPDAQQQIDEAAREAGRDRGQIRRVYNVAGLITDGPGRGLLQGLPEHWIETLTSFSLQLGFDTFVFWPAEDPVRQIQRFGLEVVPGVRQAVERARRN